MSAIGSEFYRHGIIPENNRGLASDSAAIDDEFDIQTSAVYVPVPKAAWSYAKTDIHLDEPVVNVTEFVARETELSYGESDSESVDHSLERSKSVGQYALQSA
jgi:hypothetical protein